MCEEGDCAIGDNANAVVLTVFQKHLREHRQIVRGAE